MSELETRPWIIGEAPSKTGDRFHMFPLSGPPAQVLCECAGIPPTDGTGWGRWTWALYDHFRCANVFSRYADATPWNRTQARGKALHFTIEECPRVIVCLGRKVAGAFIGDDQPFGEWIELGGGLAVATAPHPSARSRLMNEPGMRELLGKVLREARERMTMEAAR